MVTAAETWLPYTIRMTDIKETQETRPIMPGTEDSDRPLVELTHVEKHYGDLHVLKDINLTVKKGEVLVIVGPSGSGKSTMCRTINRLETIDSGDIRIDGKPLPQEGKELASLRAEVGMVFQSFNLFANKTILENVTLAPIKVRHMDKKAAEDLAMDLLSRVGVDSQASKMPSQLSGGQQQRVAIARTLAPEPQVLFMDEPLSNLDAKLRLEMRYELQRLHLETGSTFVYVTHDQMEAMTLATKICLINNGVLQQYDAPLEVYNRPTNLFAADFVGNPSINFVEATGEQSADGSVALEIFHGIHARFIPNEALELPTWFTQRDADAAAKKQAEIDRLKQKHAVEKSNKDEVFKYHIEKVIEEDSSILEDPVLTNRDLVLGIRPEAIDIEPDGALQTTIFGAMPTGMESTLKLCVQDDYLLTGVIFGNNAYRIGEQAGIDIHGSHILLFDRQSGKCIADGRLEIEK